MAAIVLHLYVVASILRQPLTVQNAPLAARSIIWPLHNDTVHRQGPAADFLALYNAGLAFRNGHPLYGRKLERGVPYCFPFRYLPVLAMTLGAAATHFSPLSAWRAWVLVNEALLLILALMLCRAIRISTPAPELRNSPPTAWRSRFFLGILLLSTPYFLELQMGQFTFAAVALSAIGLLGLAPAATGSARIVNVCCQTTASLLKVFPLVLLPVFIRQRSLWVAAAWASAAVFGLSGPYFALHPEEFRAFIASNFAETSGGLDTGNFGLIYVFSMARERLGIVEHWDAFLALWRISILGLTALLVLLSRNRDPVLGAVAMFLAHFLSYVHVWEHHMSAVIVLGLLLAWRAVDPVPPDAARNRIVRTLVFSSLVLLALPTPFVLLDRLKDPSVWDPLENSSVWLRCLLALTKALPTAVLYAVTVWLLGRGKGPRKNNFPFSHPIFGPSLSAPQSQNPRISSASPAVLLPPGRANLTPSWARILRSYFCAAPKLSPLVKSPPRD